jgi:RNA polymerase sigma-70 factor (ECF subfamily)
VFVGLERALARYEERGRFRSWLLKVTARTAQMRIRRRGATALDSMPAIASAGGPRASGRSDDAAIDRIVVRDALASMAESYRVVFLLKEVEGYRHGEIARLLGISVASSRVRLHRAWEFLEERVGGS